MTGYVRKDTTNNIADGNVINAADLDSEFDGVQAAFNASTGHKHDGTASEGATINSLGPTQDVTISASLVAPKTTNFVDIGSSGLKFKDMFLAGNGSIGGTLAVTGVATFTAQPILSSLTASRAVFSDGSKGLVSNAITGTGNVVMSASPTLTGTVGGASLTLSSLTSGRVIYAGASGLLQDSANLLFNGTTLTANTLNLTNALGTSYGGTGLTSFTANGVVYASNASTLATGSALTFDGTNFATTGTVTSGGSYNFNTTSGRDILWGTGSYTYITGNPATGVMAFGIANSEGMRLTTTGLGIGTSSPGAKLGVTSPAATTAAAAFRSGSTDSVYLTLGRNAYEAGVGVTGTTTLLTGASVGDLNIYNNLAGAAIRFGTGNAGTIQATLDASGNLGLGVTPSAWDTIKAFQSGNGSFYGFSTTEMGLSQNMYYASGAYRYITSAVATTYRQISGVHSWHTAASGTAGDPITFTQAMTLDASGNLLVGVTSTTNTSGGLILRQNGNGVDLNASGSTGAISIRGTASTGAALIDFYPVSSNPASAPFYSGRIFYSFADNYLSFATNGTERARIDSSGNLLVGKTSATYVAAGRQLVEIAGSSTALLELKGGTNSHYVYNDGGSMHISVVNAGNMLFTTSNTERMRLDSSGNLLVGTTSVFGNAKVTVSSTATDGIASTQGTAGGYCFVANALSNGGTYYFEAFTANGTNVGSITSNGTTTTYAVTSDQRLKENIVNAPEFGSVIDSIQVRSFDWKTGQFHQRAGFVAQELVSVAPEAVHQPADPEEMMAVDYSKLVPMLVKEIQSLRIRIAQLEAQ